MLMPYFFCHIEEKINKKIWKSYRGISFLKTAQEDIWQDSDQKGMRGNNKQIWEVQWISARQEVCRLDSLFRRS